MTSIECITGIEAFIRQKVEEEHHTHEKVSFALKDMYPGRAGLSTRSVRRFCDVYNIHATSRLTQSQLSRVVATAVQQVGPTYGRKTMKGLLASAGINTGQGQIGSVLPTVNPSYHHRRRTATARQINPIPYRASYFGQKLHVDQNEKLVMFGVTHICARDGYSGKIVAFASMPIKNNIEIYRHVFRPLFLQYGLWDQIRVDKGREWILSLYIQEKVAYLRTDTSRPPHLQTSSKLNHMAERVWVEINGRVNYPIKSVLIKMHECGELDMDCATHQFCTSWYTLRVASVGCFFAVESWNKHPVSGQNRGVPDDLMRRNNHTAHISPLALPTPEEAVASFLETGGHLTILSKFGRDPLENHEILQEARNQGFTQKFPDFEPFFSSTVNGDDKLFRSGLLHFISLTTRLSHSA